MTTSLRAWPQTAVSRPVSLIWFDPPREFADETTFAVYFQLDRRLLTVRHLSFLERVGLGYLRSVFGHPRRVVLCADREHEDASVRGELFVEVPDPFGDADSRLIPIGSVVRLPEHCRYPEDPERETWDFLISVLQGDPEQRVEELLGEVG